MKNVHLIIPDAINGKVKQVVMSESAYRGIRWFIKEFGLEEYFGLLSIEDETEMDF